jgi:hypothetical protein
MWGSIASLPLYLLVHRNGSYCCCFVPEKFRGRVDRRVFFGLIPSRFNHKKN